MQNRSMSTWPSSHWEDLRKQARTLENDVDAKLVNFSKLSTQPGIRRGRVNSRSDDYALPRPSMQDTVPLLSATDDNLVFEALALDIENQLSKLNNVNNQMADCVEKFNASPGAALLHTLQRHRDILQDYLQEFHKTKANVEQIRAREELFGPIKPVLTARRDPFTKENDHLKSSERMIDQQIGIAMMTKENLYSQRSTISGVVNRLGSLSGRFPAVNNIMQKINFRKRKDAIILGTVIGVCLFMVMVMVVP